MPYTRRPQQLPPFRDQRCSPGRRTAPTPAISSPDNGTPFTSRAFRARLAQLGVMHQRGGCRDPRAKRSSNPGSPSSKQCCVWREEFETLDEAREKIGAYVDRYHHRPRSRLAYRTPREVAGTWKDHDDQVNPSGLTDNNDGGPRQIVQRKALTPCFFEGLDDLAERILGFQAEFAKTATPFDWTFTRRDLNALLDRLDQRGRLTPPPERTSMKRY